MNSKEKKINIGNISIILRTISFMLDDFVISLGDASNTYYILYSLIIYNFSDSIEYPPEKADYLYDAMTNIINLSGPDYNVMVINVTLLYWVTSAYQHAKDIYFNNCRSPYILSAVKQINDFVTNHANWTSDDVLTDFVNTIGCVPYYWEVLSNEIGYDTDSWKVCS